MVKDPTSFVLKDPKLTDLFLLRQWISFATYDFGICFIVTFKNYREGISTHKIYIQHFYLRNNFRIHFDLNFNVN